MNRLGVWHSLDVRSKPVHSLSCSRSNWVPVTATTKGLTLPSLVTDGSLHSGTSVNVHSEIEVPTKRYPLWALASLSCSHYPFVPIFLFPVPSDRWEKMIFKSYVGFDRWGRRTGEEGSGWQLIRDLRR